MNTSGWISKLYLGWPDLSATQRETLVLNTYGHVKRDVVDAKNFIDLSHSTRQEIALHLVAHPEHWPLAI